MKSLVRTAFRFSLGAAALFSMAISLLLTIKLIAPDLCFGCGLLTTQKKILVALGVLLTAATAVLLWIKAHKNYFE